MFSRPLALRFVNSASQSNATGFENVCHLPSTQTIPQSFTSTNLLIVYGVRNRSYCYYGNLFCRNNCHILMINNRAFVSIYHHIGKRLVEIIQQYESIGNQ